jgi:hypothetical protein
VSAGGLDESDPVRAVVVDRGAQELERLALGGAQRQVVLDEIRRLIRVAVDAPPDPVTADLGQPRELVLRAVNTEVVDGLLERVVVIVGLRRRRQCDGGARHGGKRSQPRSLH